MKRSVLNDIASAAVALFPACFGTFIWLIFAYNSSHPTKPNAELGFVHPLSNHGSYVYLSDTESTGLVLLMIGFFAGLLVAAILVAKEAIPLPRGTPRWITYVSARVRTDFDHPTRRMKTISLCSLGVYLAIIWLAGPSIVRLVVSHGVILQM
jgi:hypothetical protein